MKRASYRAAVAWIAINDEPTLLNHLEVMDLISVQLIADLTDRAALDVAKDVVRKRRQDIAENAK